jgi:hypothetical protein
MALRLLAIVLFTMGAALIVVGVGATSFFSPQSYWSDEKAQDYLDASTALKVAATSSIRRPSPDSDPELAAAQARFNELQAELDRAIARKNYTGVALGAGGATLAAVGVVVLILRHGKKTSASDDLPPFRRS